MDNNAIVQNTSTDIQVNPLRECNPDISVIVPVYNAEQFIADTLDNVSSQSLKNIEIVCVDDGSGDSSAEIIQRKSAEDCRIRYIHQNNGGAGSARNTGIRASTGKYIAFMDADDSYPDNSVLELMFNTAEANSALICGGSCSDENNNLCSGKRSFVTEGFISFDSYQFDYLYVRFIFNRNFLVSENLFFPPYRVYEDPVFLTRAMIRAGRFYALTQPTYRYSGSHQSSNLNLTKLKDFIRGITDILLLTSENTLTELHKTTFERLNNQVSYYVETMINDSDDELWYLLIKANSAVNPDIISAGGNVCLIPAIRTIIESSRKYNKIRNSAIFRLLRKVTGKH